MLNKVVKVAEVIGILGLLIAVFQLVQSINTSRTQDTLQATQLAALQENSFMQITQNAILEEQLSIQQEMLTLQSVNVGGGPTATAAAQQIAELQGTAIALATLQYTIPSPTSPPFCSETGKLSSIPGAPPSGVFEK